MIHLRHPQTAELLVRLDYSGTLPGACTTTTDPAKAAGYEPSDLALIRRLTGVEWVAVEMPKQGEKT